MRPEGFCQASRHRSWPTRVGLAIRPAPTMGGRNAVHRVRVRPRRPLDPSPVRPAGMRAPFGPALRHPVAVTRRAVLADIPHPASGRGRNRHPVLPGDVQMLPGVAKRLQVGRDRACRRIDHVTRPRVIPHTKRYSRPSRTGGIRCSVGGSVCVRARAAGAPTSSWSRISRGDSRLPRWMCDPAACAGMDQGPPRVALEALLRLADVLDEMSGRRRTGPSCGRPPSEEVAGAPKPPAIAVPAAPEPRGRPRPAAEGAAVGGAARGARRAAAGGDGRGRGDDGQRGGRR